MLLCVDAATAARDLAAWRLTCPACDGGQLAPWGQGRERVIRLLGGQRARLRPARARCRGCGRTHILLPAWCAPRRPDGIEVIGTAAGAALRGHGHRVIAAALGVPPATVRGWLRRLRARAEQLRCHAMGELAAIDAYRGLPGPAASPLGAALNALAAAVHAARRQPGCQTGPAWPLIGLLGLARHLTPAPAADHLRRSRAPPCPQPGRDTRGDHERVTGTAPGDSVSILPPA